MDSISCLTSSGTSLPSREAWIEITNTSGNTAGGRKSLPSREAWIEITCGETALNWLTTSLPSREAWIEITWLPCPSPPFGSLPSREAWIEIETVNIFGFGRCRFPRGKRGLKYPEAARYLLTGKSLPSREAWIEILESFHAPVGMLKSLPLREAWIEILNSAKTSCLVYVASLAGSVD